MTTKRKLDTKEFKLEAVMYSRGLVPEVRSLDFYSS